MKIAYLLLCHIDPEHIARLANKLTNDTMDEVFVHVDGKSNIEPFSEVLKGNTQVHVLEDRVDIYWGGYSSVEATIKLFRAALSSGEFDRFVILQGLDYPIKSNKEIHAFFEENMDKEFIRAQNISDCSNPKEIHKYSLYWYLDKPKKKAARVRRWIINTINNRFFLKKWIIPHFKKNYVKDRTGRKMKIYQGSAQFGATRQLAEYIVNFYDENEGFNRYFRSMYAPDEAYFHTIVYNSPFIEHTPDKKADTRPNLSVIELKNLTYFEYPVYVMLFTQKSDWPKLRDSGFLYFRKASSESKELLDYIDEQHRSEQ